MRTGTLQVLDAARHAGVRRVVYAGSSSAYGVPSGEVQTENEPLHPLSPYAAAKLAGELYAEAFAATYGLEAVRVRFFNVFGPRQRPDSPYSGVIALFTAAMSQGRAPTVFGDGLQSRDFVYVTDAVQALIRASSVPGVSGQVYNIGTGRRITVLDLAAALNRLLSTDLPPRHAPPRAGDVRHSCADIRHARQQLGYEPHVPFEEGLATHWAGIESPARLPRKSASRGTSGRVKPAGPAAGSECRHHKSRARSRYIERPAKGRAAAAPPLAKSRAHKVREAGNRTRSGRHRTRRSPAAQPDRGDAGFPHTGYTGAGAEHGARGSLRPSLVGTSAGPELGRLDTSVGRKGAPARGSRVVPGLRPAVGHGTRGRARHNSWLSPSTRIRSRSGMGRGDCKTARPAPETSSATAWYTAFQSTWPSERTGTIWTACCTACRWSPRFSGPMFSSSLQPRIPAGGLIAKPRGAHPPQQDGVAVGRLREVKVKQGMASRGGRVGRTWVAHLIAHSRHHGGDRFAWAQETQARSFDLDRSPRIMEFRQKVHDPV